MTPAPRLFFRTQASPQIGMGHFMRCFALAEVARARGRDVVFLLDELSPPVAERLGEIGAEGRAMFVSVAAPGDLDDMDFSRSDWLVIDSYAATAAYIRELTKRVRTAVLDDLNALDRFDCDLLINAAMSAPEMGYAGKTAARMLLGPAYALIRGEFTKTYAPSTEGPCVALTFGGSDPANVSGACAQILHDTLPGVTIKVIAGPANTHTNKLVEMKTRIQNMRLYLSPPSVAEVLAGSELVITAAGGSIGEVAAMGLPALVLVVYDNQKAALAACPFPVVDARQRLPDNLDHTIKTLIEDEAGRTQIAARAHALVDGKGPQRILEAMFDV